MIDEKKAEINGAMLIMCIILLMCGSLWNYVLYKVEHADYKIVSVEIIGQERITKVSKWAVFECEIDGNNIEGRVISNFWEKEGDIIKVAYHKYAHTFIRPQICLDGFCYIILLYCVVLLIYFIVLLYKKLGE